MPSARLLIPATLLCAACALPAAEAPELDLLRHVPAGARVLAGINFASLTASSSGRTLISLAEAAYPPLKNLSGIPGLDPGRDVRQVLLAAEGQAGANHTLILIRGSLDPARMQAAGLRPETIDSVTVLRGADKNAPWIALLGDGVAAVGTPESVQRLLAGRGSGGQPEPSLLARAAGLSSQFEFWALSTAPTAELAGTMPEGQVSGILRGDVMKSVSESRLGVELGPSIRFRAEALTRSAKDAAALADVVRFFADVLQLSAKIRGAKEPDPMAALLARLQVQVDGNMVRAALAVDESQLGILVARAAEIGIR